MKKKYVCEMEFCGRGRSQYLPDLNKNETGF